MTDSAGGVTGFDRRAWFVTVSGIAGFLWKTKWPILFLLLFAFGVSAMRGCAPSLGKSRDALRAERDAARSEIQVQETINQRDLEIHAIARDLAVIRAQLRSQAQRGRDAIAAAAPDHEAPLDPRLVAAWRDALDGLCVPRADGARADSCGPSA